MAAQVTENGKIVEIKASGKLTVEDYKNFLPRIEDDIKKFGKVSMLFEMEDFHGWKLGAMWEDTKFGFKHFSDIDKVAMVGDRRWQKTMTTLCKPICRGRIHFFDTDKLDDAKKWLEETPGD